MAMLSTTASLDRINQVLAVREISRCTHASTMMAGLVSQFRQFLLVQPRSKASKSSILSFRVLGQHALFALSDRLVKQHGVFMAFVLSHTHALFGHRSESYHIGTCSEAYTIEYSSTLCQTRRLYALISLSMRWQKEHGTSHHHHKTRKMSDFLFLPLQARLHQTFTSYQPLSLMCWRFCTHCLFNIVSPPRTFNNIHHHH